MAPQGPSFLLIWAGVCVRAGVCVPGLVRVTITAAQLVESGSIYEIKATPHPDIRGRVPPLAASIPSTGPAKSTAFFP